jgi:hypothetical protein
MSSSATTARTKPGSLTEFRAGQSRQVIRESVTVGALVENMRVNILDLVLDTPQD